MLLGVVLAALALAGTASSASAASMRPATELQSAAGEVHAASIPATTASSAGVAGITDNCSDVRTYPKFGDVCVTGSSWAPASLVAADPLHLDVFSNGRTTHIVGPDNVDALGDFSQKWQCTELAMRWADVAWGEGDKTAWTNAGWNGSAWDMWDVAPHLAKPLRQVPNGSPQAPQMGDLLIFHEVNGNPGPGHVAIVLGVDRSTGMLTLIGENQYKLPAVVQVPISATNQVSATGFYNEAVTGWLTPAVPVITSVGTYTQGAFVYFDIHYSDPGNDAEGFGFVGVNGSGWAEENHPFTSPSYGIVGPDSIAYPFNEACGTAQQYDSYVEAWIYDTAGNRSTPVVIHLVCT